MRSGFFSARRTVKLQLRIMAAIQFRIGPEIDCFRFFLIWLQPKYFRPKLSSGVIRITTESLVEISPAVFEFLPNKTGTRRYTRAV